MSEYTKAFHKDQTEELHTHLRQPEWYMLNVKCCVSCKNYSGEVGQCDKLSEITGRIEITEWCMTCEHYDKLEGRGIVDNLYGWYEVVDDEEDVDDDVAEKKEE